MEELRIAQDLPPAVPTQDLRSPAHVLLSQPGLGLVPEERVALRLQLPQAVVVYRNGRPLTLSRFLYTHCRDSIDT